MIGRKARSTVAALGAVVLGLWAFAPAGALAQGPGDLTVRDKTELFIQHIVKVAKIEPEKYQALVLEYEIGIALDELVRQRAEAQDPPDSEEAPAIAIGDFIERALAEIHPSWGNVATLLEAGKFEEARDAARALQASADPYLAAHASLALAEAEFELARKGGSEVELGGVIRACERIVQKDRLYLARDHRACELIALCFEKLKKPLLEFVQYAILLTDYNDLPPDLTQRAKARLAALNEEVGRPLGTVANWMNEVEKLLVKEVTRDDPTQRKETEIVSALDKLIELQEARERKT